MIHIDTHDKGESMNTTNVNIPLLRKAVEWAEAEAAKPADLCEWDQRMWRTDPGDRRFRDIRANRAPECGTTYCIAGYVCEVLGIDGEAEGWALPAAEALGINPGTYAPAGRPGAADDLFHAANTIEDVRRVAEEIAGERL